MAYREYPPSGDYVRDRFDNEVEVGQRVRLIFADGSLTNDEYVVIAVSANDEGQQVVDAESDVCGIYGVAATSISLILFEKEYKCSECGEEWTDVWDCACDDRCPGCNCSIECGDYDEIVPDGYTIRKAA